MSPLSTQIPKGAAWLAAADDTVMTSSANAITLPYPNGVPYQQHVRENAIKLYLAGRSPEEIADSSIRGPVYELFGIGFAATTVTPHVAFPHPSLV